MNYMDNELWAHLNLQEHAVINGRNIWLYLISTSIGNFAVVEYEKKGDPEIVSKIIENDYDKAVSYFQSICRKKIAGKI